jgi:hypothetical protein
VPCVAMWPPDRDRKAHAPEDRFFPGDVATPATAVLSVGAQGTGGPWHDRSLTLNLLDPFDLQAVDFGGKVWPLAADRTTALAVQVDRGRALQLAALTGVVSSNLGRSLRARKDPCGARSRAPVEPFDLGRNVQ